MKTLIIAPHLDDEAISCGGLIQVRNLAGPDRVHVCFVHDRKYGYRRASMDEMIPEGEDMQAARAVLGGHSCDMFMAEEGEPGRVGFYDLLADLEEQLSFYKPDEVVIPSAQDLNQDHRHLNHVMRIALRPINLGSVSRVLECIGLDGTVQEPNYYVPLTLEQVSQKVRAVEAYRRERRSRPSPRAPDNLVAQMRVWGAQCGCEFAEAYRLRMARELCASASPAAQASSDRT